MLGIPRFFPSQHPAAYEDARKALTRICRDNQLPHKVALLLFFPLPREL